MLGLRNLIRGGALAGFALVLAVATSAGAQTTPPPAAPPATPAQPAAPAPTQPATPPAAAPAAPPAPAPAEAAPPAAAPAASEGPIDQPAAAPAAAPGAAPAPAPKAGTPLEGEVSVPAEGEPAPEAPAAEPAAEPSGAGTSEEIVVTGTRIKTKSSFAAAAPVTVVDRKQLEFSGAQNVGDVVKYLTAAGGSDFNGRNQGGWGMTQVSLRGLGPQATLVLINGRRVVPSGMVPATGGGTGSIVDIGQVPISAIDRIEVLRGGGSAIYGADAVAGVINVITRHDYDGLRIDGTAQTTEELDYAEYVAGLSLGANSERARANLSLGYNYNSNLLASDRDWTKGRAVTQIGNPATFVLLEPPRAPFQLGVNPDPDCEKSPNSKVDAQGFCTINAGRYTDIMQPTERLTMLGYGEYDLTNHTTAFAEAGVSSLRTRLHIPPSFPVLQEVWVPADHVDNPFGVRAQYFGAPLTDARGPDAILSEDDTLRLAAGLKGDFEGVAADTIAETWEWELFGTWGRSRVRGSIPDNLTDRLQMALDSCSDPNDLSRCFNPFYSAVEGTGTPNSESVLDSFRGDMQYINDSWLTTADAGLSGGLFELPGGDLGFALGAQFRREERLSDVDQEANQNHFGFVFGNSDGKADRDIGSGYLELRWPFYDGIELQTAGRFEHYETVGSRLSPQASLTVIPAEIAGRDNVVDSLRRLELHGLVTSAFRAPSIYEVFPGYVTSVLPFNDEGPTPAYVPVQTGGNPDLKYERALVSSAGLRWSPIEEWGLSGDYWRYDYDDRIVPEDVLGLYRADKNDPEHFVRSEGAGVLQLARVKLKNASFVKTHGVDFGTVVKLDLQDVGITDTKAGTIALAVDGSYVLAYEIPRADVSNLELDDGSSVPLPHCNGKRCDVAGRRNFENIAPPLPRLRLNIPLTWSDEHHSLAAIVHFISSYEDDGNADTTDGELPEIASQATLDLSYGYTLKDVIGRSTTVRIGLVNVFDSDPPPVNVLAGYDVFTHDPRGRMFYARLTQEL